MFDDPDPADEGNGRQLTSGEGFSLGTGTFQPSYAPDTIPPPISQPPASTLTQDDLQKIREVVHSELDRFEARFVNDITGNFDLIEKKLEHVVNTSMKTLMDRKERVGPVRKPHMKRPAAEDLLMDTDLEMILSRPRIVWSCTLSLVRRLSTDMKRVSQERNTFGSGQVADNQNSNGNDICALAAYFFARYRKERKAVFETPLAIEGTRFHQDTVLRLIWSARRGSLFQNNRVDGTTHESSRQMPDWLTAFYIDSARVVCGDTVPLLNLQENSRVVDQKALRELDCAMNAEERVRTAALEKKAFSGIVAEVFAESQGYKAPSSRSVKRLKGGTPRDGLLDRQRNMFRVAIEYIRKAVCDHVVDGRMRARAIIFQSFGFVIDYNLLHPDEANGRFGIYTVDICDDERKIYGDKSTVVDAIGKSVLLLSGGDGADLVDDQNKRMLTEMVRKFPSLTCEIWYEAVYKASSSRAEAGQENEPAVKWIEREEISLHAIAARFLVLAVRCDSQLMLLRSCEFSLIAIHVVALAFRALIRRSTDKPVSEVEEIVSEGLDYILVTSESSQSGISRSSDTGTEEERVGSGRILPRAGLFPPRSEHEWEKVREKINERVTMTKLQFETSKWRLESERERRRQKLAAQHAERIANLPGSEDIDSSILVDDVDPTM